MLLGATPDGPAERLTVRKRHIMTRDDTSGDGPRLPGLYAHAQFMFQTDLAAGVLRAIRRFLAGP